MYKLKCIRAIYTHNKKLTKIVCYSIKRSPYFTLKNHWECILQTLYTRYSVTKTKRLTSSSLSLPKHS